MSLREDYLVLLILVESQFLNLLPKVSQSSQKMNCSCEFLSKRKKKLFLKVSLEKKRPTTIRTSFAMTSPNKNLLPKSMSTIESHLPLIDLSAGNDSFRCRIYSTRKRATPLFFSSSPLFRRNQEKKEKTRKEFEQ